MKGVDSHLADFKAKVSNIVTVLKDLVRGHREINSSIRSLETKISEVERALDQRMTNVQLDVQAKIAALDKDLGGKIAALDTTVKVALADEISWNCLHPIVESCMGILHYTGVKNYTNETLEET